MQNANAARLRCDPTDYARKQQEKKDRAKELKEQRTKGFVDDDHTFAPKVNPRARGGAPSSREEDERPTMQRPNAGDDLPIRPSKTLQATRKEILAPDAGARKPNGNGTSTSRPNNNEDHHGHGSDVAGDALDSLSRKFPKKAAVAREPEDADANASPTRLQPEHDSLYREVKRTTGHGIEDIPIAKLNSGANKAAKHSGPCLRNSSCTCPQCGGTATTSSNTRADPPARRREPAARPPEGEAYSPPTTTSRSSHGAQSEMENSLTLLKSKMSRRKARTAPSNQASLYDDAPPPREPASKSARQPSSSSSSAASTIRRPAAQQPEPSTNTRGQAPAARKQPPQQQQHDDRSSANPRRLQRHQEEEDEQEYARAPPPISSGAELPDEYADDAEEMAECGNCHRRFNVVSFAKHQKVCEKVFSGPRKVFDMTAKRLEGTEAEKLLKQSGKKGKGKNAASANDEKPIKAKAVDWKQQSNAFRDAMRANREIGQAIKEGKPLPPMAPSAPDPSLIPCDYCGRRFNDRAAERHIAYCKEKAQRGGGGPVKKPAAAAKPSAAKAPPPRKR